VSDIRAPLEEIRGGLKNYFENYENVNWIEIEMSWKLKQKVWKIRFEFSFNWRRFVKRQLREI
jgi:hypothetical protein